MIRSRLLAIIVIAGSGLAAAAASAQPSSPEGGDTRFTFHRADDGGYLRLDGRSGQVSMCQRRTTGWQCQLVPDERTALEAEISRLQSDNAVLKKELLSRNLPLPDGMRPDQPGSKSLPKSQVQRPQLPDDAELNRIMGVMEKIWRRMVEMIQSVQRDLQKRI
ncbi:MAG TPA: hypothetical protein VFB68_15835 [Xanthobacteraceae bacterium]|nr:hypothetical protein [Xanthobacteraceae bacterium]